jgi:hypothetical protein
VRDGVKDFAVGHLANAIVLQTHHRRQAVLFGDPVSLRRGAVAHGAGDVETLLTAFQ